MYKAKDGVYREVWYSQPTGRVKEIGGVLHQEIISEGMEQGGLAGISTFKTLEWIEKPADAA